jgi:hypothetical protein
MCHVLVGKETDTGFWWENLKEGDHLEDLIIGGKIILKFNLKKTGWEGVYLIHLAQERDK